VYSVGEEDLNALYDSTPTQCERVNLTEQHITSGQQATKFWTVSAFIELYELTTCCDYRPCVILRAILGNII
jgi:hypothetical protein